MSWIVFFRDLTESATIAMTNVLHFAHGLTSCQNSLLEMLARFKLAGIDVTVASHIDLSDPLQHSDVDFVHLSQNQQIHETCQDDIRRACAAVSRKNPISAYVSRKRLSFQLQRRARSASLQSREIQQLVEHTQPDLLLIDHECHFAIIATRKMTVPTLLCSRFFSVFYSSGLPPMHSDLQPVGTVFSQVAIKLKWCGLWLFKKRLLFKDGLSRRRFRTVRYDSVSRFDLLELMKTVGLDAKKTTDVSHWQIPHVYHDIPVMSLTARELDFPQAQDNRISYVGAMVGSSVCGAPKLASGLERLSQFLKHPDNVGKPLVYCSLSTFWQTNSDHLQTILSLFANRTDLNLVVGLGGKTEVISYTADLPNVLLLAYAPQVEILQQASIAISHGGVSTVNEALHAGVPLIICSAGHVDQDGNAARVDYHGMGYATRSKPLCALELESLINKLLADGEQNIVRQNVSRIQRALKTYDDSNAAVNIVKSNLPDHCCDAGFLTPDV